MCSNQLTIKMLKAGKRFYHRFGLKHYLLFGLYCSFIVIASTIFYILEHDPSVDFKNEWYRQLEDNRTVFLRREVMPELFNNSRFLIFLNDYKTDGIVEVLRDKLAQYELRLGVRPPAPRYEWDYLNSILYSCSVSTTIGYGLLYPITDQGRIATMIFTVLGIPFTMILLRDLSGLLTQLLNYPGVLLARCWDVFRFCTLQAIDEETLRLRDGQKSLRQGSSVPRAVLIETMLSIPTIVAIFALIGWIFAGAFLFCLWEENWTVLTSFYFCFSSLSTVGFGDIIPTDPHMHLMMFIYIFIGLAVVSLFVNLVHVKISRAYWFELLSQPPSRRHHQRPLPALIEPRRESVVPSPTERYQGTPHLQGSVQNNDDADSKASSKLGSLHNDAVRESEPLLPQDSHHQHFQSATPLPHGGTPMPRMPRAYVESFDGRESASDIDLSSYVTLGILQMQDSRPLVGKGIVKRDSGEVKQIVKAVQTNLTLPVNLASTRRLVRVEQSPGDSGYPSATVQLLTSRSVDDVVHLLGEGYE